MTVTHAPCEPTAPLVDQRASELEDVFEEHSVSSHTVTSSLNLEREVYAQHGFLRAPPAVSQVAYALPHGTCEFPLQVIDLAQGWCDTVTVQFAPADLLAVVAGVCISVKLHFIPGQRCPHAVLQLLESAASKAASPFQPRILPASASWLRTGTYTLRVDRDMPVAVRPTTAADEKKQSLLLPSSLIDWQQPILTLAHPASPPWHAKSA